MNNNLMDIAFCRNFDSGQWTNPRFWMRRQNNFGQIYLPALLPVEGEGEDRRPNVPGTFVFPNLGLVYDAEQNIISRRFFRLFRRERPRTRRIRFNEYNLEWLKYKCWRILRRPYLIVILLTLMGLFLV